MADKDIKIRIVAQGGSQAARELQKVEHAAERAMGRPTGTTGLAGTSAGAAKQLGKVAKEAPKVTKSSANMGRAVLEGSRAFEDLQYGIRGVLNNIPGLVMALGGGAGVAGAVSLLAVSLSILAPKLKELIGEEDDEKLQDYADKLAEIKDKVRDLAEAKGEAAAREFLENLDAEEEAINLQNKALQRQIQLIRAKKDAQTKTENTQLEERIEEIEANPDLSEADKIRRKAGIQEQIEQNRAKQKLRPFTRERENAEQRKTEADEAVRRQSEDIDQVKAALRSLESQYGKQVIGVRNHQKLKSEQTNLVKQKEKKEGILSKSGGDAIFGGAFLTSSKKQRVEEKRSEIQAIEAKIADLEQRISTEYPVGGAQRITQLAHTISNLRDGLTGQREAHDQARKDQQEAVAVLGSAKQRESIEQTRISEEYQSRRRIRSSRTGRRASEAEERERKEREDLARKEEERRDNARESRARDEAGVGREALRILNQSSSSLSGDAFQRGQAAVEEIVAKLQDGDQGGELDRLASLVEHLASAVQGKNKATDVKIDQLQQQIKNMRQPNK